MRTINLSYANFFQKVVNIINSYVCWFASAALISPFCLDADKLDQSHLHMWLQSFMLVAAVLMITLQTSMQSEIALRHNIYSYSNNTKTIKFWIIEMSSDYPRLQWSNFIRGKTLSRVSAILYKGDIVRDFPFAFLHITFFLKRSLVKKKEFAHFKSKFFPFRVDHFAEETKPI